MSSSSMLSRLGRRQPRLTFSPLAWLKLQFFCHMGETEIAGFGIASEKDLLYVEQFVTVKQQASPVTVALDDAAVADYMDACVDAGLTPERCLRIWCHTHPGSSPEPSGTDEHTFARVFGACQWAVMFIVSRTAATFARLSFHVGPVAAIDVPVVVDWKSWPADLADRAATQLLASWQDEHRANIHGFPKQQAITPVADEKPLGGSPPEHTAPVWDWDEIDDRLLEEYERYFGCFAFD